MIGLVLSIRVFIKFGGGGDIHSKKIVTRLAKRTDILFLPPSSEIINNYREICNSLDKIPFNFPDFIKKCEKLSYSEILRKYSEYLNDVKILYDPITYIYMDMSSKLNKAKLFLRSLSR